MLILFKEFAKHNTINNAFSYLCFMCMERVYYFAMVVFRINLQNIQLHIRKSMINKNNVQHFSFYCFLEIIFKYWLTLADSVLFLKGFEMTFVSLVSCVSRRISSYTWQLLNRPVLTHLLPLRIQNNLAHLLLRKTIKENGIYLSFRFLTRRCLFCINLKIKFYWKFLFCSQLHIFCERIQFKNSLKILCN